jgi:type 1 glutamine amidotransferase
MRGWGIACAILLASACATPADVGDKPSTLSSKAPPAAPAIRVLAVTATAGFRHGSIPTAIQALQTAARQRGGLDITFTENLTDLDAARFATIDVLAFVLVSGELALDAAQKMALIAFVENGGGFIGVHSAADALYDWPEYGRLVGAYFKDHPWTQEAGVIVEDRAHPSTSHLGAGFGLLEEYYTFRENPRPSVQVLLSLDAASVGGAGDFPLAWTQTVGSGRSFYTALGHFESTWTDARFEQHLLGAIDWVARRQN